VVKSTTRRTTNLDLPRFLISFRYGRLHLQEISLE
jgi:hypothetical protein